MKTLLINTEPEWLRMLDAIAERLGEPSRAALVERLASERAAGLGIERVTRLRPSRFNGWLRPHERATSG